MCLSGTDGAECFLGNGVGMIKLPETVGILIASYKRPGPLVACLDSLTLQHLTPHEVIVVLRDNDMETRQALTGPSSPLPLKIVFAGAPGPVAARNAGLDA